MNEILTYIEQNLPEFFAIITGSSFTIAGVWTALKALWSVIRKKASLAKQALANKKFTSTYIEPLTEKLGVDMVEKANELKDQVIEKAETTIKAIDNATAKINTLMTNLANITLRLDAYMQTVLSATGDSKLLATYEEKKAELLALKDEIEEEVEQVAEKVEAVTEQVVEKVEEPQIEEKVEKVEEDEDEEIVYI